MALVDPVRVRRRDDARAALPPRPRIGSHAELFASAHGAVLSEAEAVQMYSGFPSPGRRHIWRERAGMAVVLPEEGSLEICRLLVLGLGEKGKADCFDPRCGLALYAGDALPLEADAELLVIVVVVQRLERGDVIWSRIHRKIGLRD